MASFFGTVITTSSSVSDEDDNAAGMGLLLGEGACELKKFLPWGTGGKGQDIRESNEHKTV